MRLVCPVYAVKAGSCTSCLCSTSDVGRTATCRAFNVEVKLNLKLGSRQRIVVLTICASIGCILISQAYSFLHYLDGYQLSNVGTTSPYLEIESRHEADILNLCKLTAKVCLWPSRLVKLKLAASDSLACLDRNISERLSPAGRRSLQC